MHASRFKMATMFICAAASVGCGGSNEGGGGITPPAAAVLTTVEVKLSVTELFSVAPGNTAALVVVAKDQYGALVQNIGSPSFTSQNSAVATVGGDGIITAAGVGTAQITASVSAGGVTKSGIANLTVRVAPATATVTAPGLSFDPATVDISAGGSVTWSIGAIHHNVSFTSAGAPAGIEELRDASASRTFLSNGIYAYNCAFHSGMAGIIRVH